MRPVTLLTAELRAVLLDNGVNGERVERDPVPVVKLFSPVGAATWLAIELDADGDTLFGLADLGLGCPELGSFSLSEIAAVRLPFGLLVERDRSFVSDVPLSRWAEIARRHGSIIAAEAWLAEHGGAGTPDPDNKSDSDLPQP
jgi:hypothetical protein